jgi:hypothetical protein
MKLKLMLLSGAMFCVTVMSGQYTSLPKLDEAEYNKFITSLRIHAVEQNLPELNVIADKMTYDEARRFMANPHVFTEKMKEDYAQVPGGSAIDAVKVGVILSILFSHFTGVPDGVNAKIRIGFAFGLYAMYTLGTVYLLSELMFTYMSASMEIGSYTTILKLSYISLLSTLVYGIVMQDIKFLVGAGLVLSFGIAGKEKFNDSSYDLEFGSDGLKRFRAGLVLTTGVMLASGFLASLQYCLFFGDLFAQGSNLGMNTLMLKFGIPFMMLKSGRSN